MAQLTHYIIYVINSCTRHVLEDKLHSASPRAIISFLLIPWLNAIIFQIAWEFMWLPILTIIIVQMYMKFVDDMMWNRRWIDQENKLHSQQVKCFGEDETKCVTQWYFYFGHDNNIMHDNRKCDKLSTVNGVTKKFPSLLPFWSQNDHLCVCVSVSVCIAYKFK